MRKIVITLGIAVFSFVAAYGQYPEHVIVEPLLKTDSTSTGQKIKYPKVENAEVSMLKITLKPGSSTGWHKHDIPLFAYVLQGVLTVETEEGKLFQFEAGSAMSEVIGHFHRGINRGKEDLVLIAIYLGGKGMPLSVPKESPEMPKQ